MISSVYMLVMDQPRAGTITRWRRHTRTYRPRTTKSEPRHKFVCTDELRDFSANDVNQLGHAGQFSRNLRLDGYEQQIPLSNARLSMLTAVQLALAM